MRLLSQHKHIVLGGFHIEEAIYGPLYYYSGKTSPSIRHYEPEMPDDTILVHLKATPDVIRSRMESDPHEYPLVRKEDITLVQQKFEEGYHDSWIPNKIEINTSNLTSAQLLQEFLDRSLPFLNARDTLTRMMDTRQ